MISVSEGVAARDGIAAEFRDESTADSRHRFANGNTGVHQGQNTAHTLAIDVEPFDSKSRCSREWRRENHSPPE
jgi:hypothetical protein